MSWYEWDGQDLILRLKIQPRASRDQWGEVLGSERKLKIKAPPVDGKANAYLIQFLAQQFKQPKKNIIIEAGQQSRHKRIRIKAIQFLPEALI